MARCPDFSPAHQRLALLPSQSGRESFRITYGQGRVDLALLYLLALLSLRLVLALLLATKLVGNGSLVLGVQGLVRVGLALLVTLTLVDLGLGDVALYFMSDIGARRKAVDNWTNLVASLVDAALSNVASRHVDEC